MAHRKKISVTGSIAQVGNKELKKAPKREHFLIC